jgi:hypothetical protein
VDSKEQLKAFHKALDDDKGLKSKRQLVTYVSLVILAINLSGATIQEANTFLFKIHFLRPEGLHTLLAISLLFCTIRYFNYSYKYDKQLSDLWKKRFLNDHRVLPFDDRGDEYQGLLSPAVNKDFRTLYAMLRNGEIEKFDSQYICSLLSYKKAVLFDYIDNHGEDSQIRCNIGIKEIGLLELLEVTYIEWSYRLGSYFTHREVLDLRAPYILAALAFTSIPNNERLHYILTFLE